MRRLQCWGCQNIWPKRKLHCLRCTPKADLRILQHHPWGSVGSQRAAPGDQFQISSQYFGQGYHLNINPSMFPGYGGYAGGVPREKLPWHESKLCKERTNKHARIQTMGLPANSVWPLDPFHCYTVNESAESGQKQRKHRLMKSKSLLVQACSLTGGSKKSCQTRRKGTSEDMWKSRSEKDSYSSWTGIEGKKAYRGNIPVKPKQANKRFNQTVAL